MPAPKNRKRKRDNKFSLVHNLPDSLIQLIWEFIPIYDGIMFSTCTKKLHSILSMETNAIRRIRDVVNIDGCNLYKQLHLIGSTRKINNLRFQLDRKINSKAHESFNFIKKYLDVKTLTFKDPINGITLKRLIESFSNNNIEIIYFCNALGDYDHCTQQKKIKNTYNRTLAINELSKVYTTHIYIKEEYINPVTLKSLFETIKQMKGLNSIHIHNTYIGDDNINYFSQLSIREITATDCYLSEPQVRLMKPLLANVTTLNLGYNNLECGGVNTLFKSLSLQKGNLSSLTLEYTFQYGNEEEEIFDITAFKSFCRCQPSLTSLNLSGNRITDEFILDNKNSIECLHKLEKLELGSNLICENGVHKLSRISNKLDKLDLNGNRIEQIKLTKFSDRMFNYISELNLGNIPVKNECLIDIANYAYYRYAFQRLIHLGMICCDLVDSSIYNIFEILRSCTKLLLLDLEENCLTDYAYTYFCQQLEGITDRKICIILTDNYISTSRDAPAPHSIIC